MDYSVLIRELTESYSRQLACYNQLKIIVQKILGQMSVSRGDVAGVMGLFEEKIKVLGAIDRERVQAKENNELWRQAKRELSQTASAAQLDEVLAATETAIREFLEIEEQLRRYLEHSMTGKGNAVSQ